MPFMGIGICAAQTRYQKLTGWECPARGGPTSEAARPGGEQRAIDRDAREKISHEMGHGRGTDYGSTGSLNANCNMTTRSAPTDRIDVAAHLRTLSLAGCRTFVSGNPDYTELH